MIIVEYCKYGSLLRFLQNNRPGFVDQVNRGNDTIDSTITAPSRLKDNQVEFELDAQSATNSAYIPGSIVNSGQDVPNHMNKIGNSSPA